MKVQQLSLVHFRNYTKLELQFNENIILIVGNNAQGKTNLVESIYTLAFSKSYRARSEKELIFWNEAFAKIAATISFDRNRPRKTIDYVISTKGKKIRVNQVEQKSKSDYVGLINVIKFSPEDLTLVKGSPSLRRKFLDIYISQIDKQYLMTLLHYNHLIKQKNALLKNKKTDKVLLTIYNQKLAGYIEIILAKRKQFIIDITPFVNRFFQQMVSHTEIFHFEYVSTMLDISTCAEIEAYLNHSMEKEINRCSTLVGTHKDDLDFFINDRNVKQFGSQGQQRTVVLSMVSALVTYMHEQTGEYPILILDDVMSELDDTRKVQLLDSFTADMQIFLTTTSVSDILDKIDKPFELYHVQAGNLIKEGEA